MPRHGKIISNNFRYIPCTAARYGKEILFFGEGMAKNCRIKSSHRDTGHSQEGSDFSIIGGFFDDLFCNHRGTSSPSLIHLYLSQDSVGNTRCTCVVISAVLSVG